MENKPIILIVEDEKGISNFISAILTSNDYSVIKCTKGSEAVSMTASYCPELILLDLGLPDIDGIEVLRSIREWSDVPVIVVTARNNEAEKVEAFDLGADDYITKPFGTMELLARIRTAIRHKQNNSYNPLQTDKIKIGGLVIDAVKRNISLDEKVIHLTPIEYKILLLLAKNAGRVLTLDFICKEIWGPYTNEQNALRVNMANIRRKIEENPAEPKYILTEVGVGYRMVEGI
ncbi:MAG: DNA-binding response regulator [Clostridiales bacterium 43-6]|nr:MAG: DNA-binding response regulator [Clostridiales bacterium 43-6]